MTGFRRSVPIAAVLAVALCSPSLFARPNGFAAECGGCHYGQLEGGGIAPAPVVAATASASRVEPGAELDITVHVNSMWPDALVAGFLVITEPGAGAFTPSEAGTGNVGLKEGEALDYAIGHTLARELANGSATFRTRWTAPMAAGSYAFTAYAVTSDDGDGMDEPEVAEETNDPFGKYTFEIGVGCDLDSFYYDGDGDGYGAEEVRACDPPAGTVLQGGDCNDDEPQINPGAVERCSFVDEDCDGEAMAPPTFYRDADGDGYGVMSEILVEVDTCTAPEGYAVEYGDCAPADPGVHPGAVEVADNGVDDDCDGLVDEASTSVNPAAMSPSDLGPDGSEQPVPAGSGAVGSSTSDTAAPTAMPTTVPSTVPPAPSAPSASAPIDVGAAPGAPATTGTGPSGASGCRISSVSEGFGLLGVWVLAGLALARRRTAALPAVGQPCR